MAKRRSAGKAGSVVAVVLKVDSCGHHCHCMSGCCGAHTLVSELRFEKTVTVEQKGCGSMAYTGFTVDRARRGRGPLDSGAVRNRAAILAAALGVPLIDETVESL